MNSYRRKYMLMTDLIMPIAIFIIIYPPVFYSIRFTVNLSTNITRMLFVICLIWFVKYRLYKNKYLWAWLIFILWLVAVTFVNSKKIPYMINYYNIFNFMVIICYCIKKKPERLIGWIATILTCWIFLNTLLWKEGGMYVNANGQMAFFLGTKTSLTYYQITGCYFIWLFHEILPEKHKKRATFLWIVMFTSVVVWNIRQPISTSIMCLILFTLLLYLSKKENLLIDIILKSGFIVTIAINIGIVFFNIQKLFTDFIVNVLHESADLNNRTKIWQVVIYNILKSPIIGHGTDSNIIFAIDNGISQINSSAHNHLLHLLFTCGIIGTLYFIFICLKSLHRAGIKTTTGRLLHITLICFGLMWISEQLKGYNMIVAVLMAGICIRDMQLMEGKKDRL